MQIGLVIEWETLGINKDFTGAVASGRHFINENRPVAKLANRPVNHDRSVAQRAVANLALSRSGTGVS